MATPQVADSKNIESAGGHHPFIVKVMHWLNVAFMVIMLASGLVIWLKHPSFFDFPAKLADRKLFDSTSPLGGPLIWHFAGLWLLIQGLGLEAPVLTVTAASSISWPSLWKARLLKMKARLLFCSTA